MELPLKHFGILALLLIFKSTNGTSKHPNVVFIIADDMVS